MKIITTSELSSAKQTSFLVVPCFQTTNGVEVPKSLSPFSKFFDLPLKRGDFGGKEGEVCVVYPPSTFSMERVCLIGLGEASHLTTERLRRAYALVVKYAVKHKVKALTVAYPETPNLIAEQTLRGVFEGIFLTNYIYTHKAKKDIPALLETLELIGFPKKSAAYVKKTAAIAEGVYYARNLVNDNADKVTPAYLAQKAVDLGKLPHVKTTIHDRAWLEKQGFGLLMAVGRASKNSPRLIVSTYKGNPRSQDNTLLVGKGVTYDTGGLNLKPTGGMETMRCDMAGAAAVLGALFVAAKLELKQNITIVIPSVENAIDADSYKPGDVYTSYSGKTVEIANTDAEGRLILADALSYAVKHLKPTRIVDIATLTGACEIALGNEVTGLFTYHDAMADLLMRAGVETYERVWRLPLVEEYKDLLKCELADIKNHGGRSGGAILGAIFLSYFTENIPWAHLDIAGTAFYSDGKRYHPKMATGVGVRLLVELLELLG